MNTPRNAHPRPGQLTPEMQYRDERFNKLLNGLRYPAAGPWILAIPREDLDPSSKSTRTDHVTYQINAKVDQTACMHVLSKGRGRVRLGYREHIPVEVGDLVLVNMREAGHWISLGFEWGPETLYLFTGDVPFLRMFRTDKSDDAPQQQVGEPDGAFTARRNNWHNEWRWNVAEVLSDYVLLGRDPTAETKMRNGPKTMLAIPGTYQTDGTRSDNARDNRFPIVYRRVMGVGPGKWLTRESDLGVVEREETKSEAKPGDMMAMCDTVKAGSFVFQGAPFQVIHASSVLVYEQPGASALHPPVSVEVHESVPQPLTWVDPNDTPEDEDPEAAAGDQLGGLLGG